MTPYYAYYNAGIHSCPYKNCYFVDKRCNSSLSIIYNHIRTTHDPSFPILRWPAAYIFMDPRSTQVIKFDGG